MIYDAGYSCDEHVGSLIPTEQQIDLLVLSHNDTDHIATDDEILQAYSLEKILWTGFERPERQRWTDVNQAINDETEASVINLRTDTLAIGSTWIYGDTYVTFVAGFHVPPDHWGFTPSQASEYRNAGSIALRIVYKGRSILLTGDMIGRHEEGNYPEYHITAAEKFVVDNRFAVPIDSDVLVASHHGGNDASSYPFIQAVSPQYVIFSAGSHDTYAHPRAAVAQRFLNSGVLLENMFRTDLGDDEIKPEHWENESTITGRSDFSGDDHVQVSITQDGVLEVEYCE
jgi:beta-lactamase superfamily II metal-dependent hydrolase